jgi:hypothetical protein
VLESVGPYSTQHFSVIRFRLSAVGFSNGNPCNEALDHEHASEAWRAFHQLRSFSLSHMKTSMGYTHGKLMVPYYVASFTNIGGLKVKGKVILIN